MNRIENGRLNTQIYDEIEQVREKLNRLKDIAGVDALKLSLQLDQLILEAMKNNGG